MAERGGQKRDEMIYRVRGITSPFKKEDRRGNKSVSECHVCGYMCFKGTNVNKSVAQPPKDWSLLSLSNNSQKLLIWALKASNSINKEKLIIN